MCVRVYVFVCNNNNNNNNNNALFTEGYSISYKLFLPEAFSTTNYTLQSFKRYA